eukprot:505096-Rhodomonas_salina.1
MEGVVTWRSRDGGWWSRGHMMRVTGGGRSTDCMETAYGPTPQVSQLLGPTRSRYPSQYGCHCTAIGALVQIGVYRRTGGRYWPVQEQVLIYTYDDTYLGVRQYDSRYQSRRMAVPGLQYRGKWEHGQVAGKGRLEGWREGGGERGRGGERGGERGGGGGA